MYRGFVTNVHILMSLSWKNTGILYNVIKDRRQARRDAGSGSKIVSAWAEAFSYSFLVWIRPKGWRLRHFAEALLILWVDNWTWRDIKLFRSRDMGRAVAVRRWTPTALECYKRGCNCEGCFYRDFFSGSSQKCQMKASVLELVRVIGTPNIELQQFLIEE